MTAGWGHEPESLYGSYATDKVTNC
jgi:hypothetical protein